MEFLVVYNSPYILYLFSAKQHESAEKWTEVKPHLPSGTSTSEILGEGMRLSRSCSLRQAKSPALVICAVQQCHKSKMTY